MSTLILGGRAYRGLVVALAAALAVGTTACGSSEAPGPPAPPTPGTFTPTGSLGTGRWAHTATLLPNGEVLIAAGVGSGSLRMAGFLDSAELYNPAAGTFTLTGSMTTARASHTETLLPSGQVLIVGGFTFGMPLSSADLYDPGTRTFTATGSLDAGTRTGHTATLLSNGRVLIAGGQPEVLFDGILTGELYDPATGTFTTTGSLGLERPWGHTATLLPSGKVLIAGGAGPTANSELYDPATGMFTATGTMGVSRDGHTATLLSSGKVLIAGGAGPLASSELYDPAAGTFTVTESMGTARQSHTATLLPSGKVLIVGGWGPPPAQGLSAPLSSAELYTP